MTYVYQALCRSEKLFSPPISRDLPHLGRYMDLRSAGALSEALVSLILLLIARGQHLSSEYDIRNGSGPPLEGLSKLDND